MILIKHRFSGHAASFVRDKLFSVIFRDKASMGFDVCEWGDVIWFSCNIRICTFA
jgi:hypothetical protein